MKMNIREALRYAKDCLSPFSDEAAKEARIIVSHLAELPPNRLAICEDDIQKEKIDVILGKRKEGVPLQYILGKWWFYKSEFLVGEGVLIPRQDTEILVETAIDLLKGKQNPTVCDLCSGSGCIAVSIALERNDATVIAVEKYDEAFEYLVKNINHNKSKNAEAVKYDVTEKPFGKYDLIVCNPPYIPETEKSDLSREVLNEPHSALFGGDDGLYFYRIITKNWKQCLNPDGILAFEVGIKEADEVKEILKKEGFTNIGTRQDLIGIQRVVFGTVNSIK